GSSAPPTPPAPPPRRARRSPPSAPRPARPITASWPATGTGTRGSTGRAASSPSTPTSTTSAPEPGRSHSPAHDQEFASSLHAAPASGRAGGGPDSALGKDTTMSTRRKIVLTSTVVLLPAAALGFGSFATFNAQTNNPNNLFAHGTIVLSNTKQGGSACLSTGGGNTNTNVNAACDQLLNLTVRKPGDSGTANLTLK